MALQGAISAAAPAASSLISSSGFSGGSSAWLGALTSGVGLIANAVSSRKAFKRQQELMKLQAELNYEYNKKQTLNQYLWQRQGLTNADYNPLLALQGASSPSAQSWAGSPSSPQADFTGLVGDFSNATDKIMQNQMFKSNLENIVSQTDLNKSNVRLNTEKAINLGADTDLKQSQKLMTDEELKYVPARRRSEIYHNLASARAELMQAVASQTSANASQISANAQRIRADSDVRLQDQLIEKYKTDMNLTKAQTDQIRQIIRWYGYREGSEIIRNLSLSGYFATGSIKNITSAGTDVLQSLLYLPVP